MYKAIIFDFFGVIHNDQYNDWLSKHGLERKGKLAELSNNADKGNLSINEFFGNLANFSGQNYDQVVIEFKENTKFDYKVIDVIKFLKNQDYKIGLLSNASASYLGSIKEFQTIEHLFDEVIVSGNVGMAKPDPRFFEYALNKMEVPAEQTIFIDDSPVNVEASEQLGITGIVFRNANRLIKDLDNLLSK